MLKIIIIISIILVVTIIFYSDIIKIKGEISKWHNFKNNLGWAEFYNVFKEIYKKGTFETVIALENKTSPLVNNFQHKDLIIDKNFDYLINNQKKYLKNNYKDYQSSDNQKLTFDVPLYQLITKVNLKENNLKYRSNIPKIIWQTFYKKIEKEHYLYKNTETWKNLENYQYNFLDDNQGEEFIKNNFDNDVLKAYQNLVPGAYKADLLRVCLVYHYGGIYADIKLKLNYYLEDFLDRDLVLVRDGGPTKIWNGFFAAIPKHPFIKKILEKIVKNINHKKYGINDTDITGPTTWFSLFVNHYKKFLHKYELSENYRIMQFLSFKDYNLVSRDGNFEPYMNFPKDYKKSYNIKTKNDYSQLWKDKKVFKN